MRDFLPVSREDMQERGIDTLDFIFVSGDAYVDHPSFGAAVIARLLEDLGYSVGIIAQPNWRNTDDFKKLGRPRLGFLVSSGNIDSMVAHYTSAKKRRGYDYYSPNGKTGLRPDRAVIVYCNLIRQAFGDAALIIGGLEASLRRMAHFDYWDNKIRRSILIDSRADILCYGMGEK
ncbi:MAG: YgiQ family radical SAM protein, partial [Oscillospiraceae bacterium]|nr:YgiQ family radical SAM protein [Oscillospiraceae bacterium]